MNFAKTKVKLLVAILPLAGIIYFFSHFNPQAILHYAIAAILIAASFASMKYGSLLFFIATILIDDFPKFYSEELRIAMPFVSLFTLEIGGITIYLLLAVYFSIINLVSLLFMEINKNGRSYIATHISPEIKVILIVGVASMLIGLPNIVNVARIYVSDLGYFVNILLGFLIIRNMRKDEEVFHLAFLLMIYAVMSKVIIVSFDAIFLSMAMGVVTIAPGTDAYLVGAVILFSILSLRTLGAARLGQSAAFVLMIVMTLTYFIFTASRGRMLIAAISFLIFLFAIRKWSGILYIGLIASVVGLALPILSSEYLNYFMWKLSTFVASEDGGESSLVRVISFQNIMAEQLDAIYKFFVGTGLGGYFTSQHFPFPFDLTGRDAFPDEWIANDTFYKPHTSPMFLLLKTGTVGFMFIFCIILVQNIRGLKFVRTLSSVDNRNMIVLLTVLPLIVPMFMVNFSSKLQLATGALLGFVYFASRFQREQGC